MDRLLTVDETAERLNTSPRFVRRLIEQRRMGFTRIGRKVRIPESDLSAFLARGHVKPLTVRDVWKAVR